MLKSKLIRITTVPVSLEKLLEGQLAFMKEHFLVTAVSSQSDKLKEYGEKEGVNVFPLELTRKITPYRDVKAVYRLVSYFRAENPTIVHTHTPKAGIVGMMAAYLARVPIRLHTVAGLPLMETRGLKRFVLIVVERLTYKMATHVYPNSKGLYEFILSKNMVPEAKLTVLGKGSSNGIDTAYFSREHYSNAEILAKKEAYNIPINDFVFLFVGRVVGDKGINELVNAFSELQKNQPNCTLLLVGPYETDLDPVLDVTRKEISTNPKINAIGYVQDVRPYFAMSDVLVFPSYREGFPNVVMQAGAMKLPSIVSDINGCNEIIAHEKNGLIIPPKDSKALQNAMLRVMQNELERQLWGETSWQIVCDRYKRSEIWQLILAEYRRLETKL